MTQYAQFDHTATPPCPVIGWYDTALFDYPNLPAAADLLELTADQWNARMSQLWAVENGALVDYVPPPPTLQDQASAMLTQPVTVVSAAVPAVNADYPIDPATRTQMTSIAATINAGLGLPGGGSTFNWADVNGNPHQWPQEQFTAFAGAVMNFVYACTQVVQGHSTTLPDTTLSIP
jgi:hypothetical protein